MKSLSRAVPQCHDNNVIMILHFRVLTTIHLFRLTLKCYLDLFVTFAHTRLFEKLTAHIIQGAAQI